MIEAEDPLEPDTFPTPSSVQIDENIVGQAILPETDNIILLTKETEEITKKYPKIIEKLNSINAKQVYFSIKYNGVNNIYREKHEYVCSIKIVGNDGFTRQLNNYISRTDINSPLICTDKIIEKVS